MAQINVKINSIKVDSLVSSRYLYNLQGLRVSRDFQPLGQRRVSGNKQIPDSFLSELEFFIILFSCLENVYIHRHSSKDSL